MPQNSQYILLLSSFIVPDPNILQQAWYGWASMRVAKLGRLLPNSHKGRQPIPVGKLLSSASWIKKYIYINKLSVKHNRYHCYARVPKIIYKTENRIKLEFKKHNLPNPLMTNVPDMLRSANEVLIHKGIWIHGSMYSFNGWQLSRTCNSLTKRFI